jgi:hypothetical protein
MCHRACFNHLCLNHGVLDVHYETRDVTTHAHGCEGTHKACTLWMGKGIG